MTNQTDPAALGENTRDMLDVFIESLAGADRVVVETKNALGHTDAHYMLAPDILKALNTRATDPAALVKRLDETERAEIVDAAYLAMKKASGGARGQMITEWDSVESWVILETQRRIMSALTVIDAKALVKAALERAADIISAECFSLPSGDASRSYNAGVRDAISAFRSLADDPDVVAEIVQQVKGENE